MTYETTLRTTSSYLSNYKAPKAKLNRAMIKQLLNHLLNVIFLKRPNQLLFNVSIRAHAARALTRNWALQIVITAEPGPISRPTVKILRFSNFQGRRVAFL
ncbi:brefeldin A-inhibited guanine nucleotide-exchange protein [Striga asiatica]|uniref:Brefeldin A-inhibited guanine nucleotide-exchange protein n=1 Tax=Striga asiatica TaxID=4170 RepID=A0A5A7QJK2_STRAF|nr:brefeldin A-inhibited guanine nucleotide-exchange protein [Striga asiatica]